MGSKSYHHLHNISVHYRPSLQLQVQPALPLSPTPFWFENLLSSAHINNCLASKSVGQWINSVAAVGAALLNLVTLDSHVSKSHSFLCETLCRFIQYKYRAAFHHKNIFAASSSEVKFTKAKSFGLYARCRQFPGNRIFFPKTYEGNRSRVTNSYVLFYHIK